jgi:signal transduction histidine kinase
VWSLLFTSYRARCERQRPTVALSGEIMDQARWLHRLRLFIYLACGVAFLVDISTSDTLAFGVIYVPMVCTALLDSSRRRVWWLCGLAIVMIVVGTFVPSINPNLSDLIGNRLLSIVAILITGALVSYAGKIRECLAKQTERAERAEKVKTEIFTNIGYDLRAPLHAVIGMAQLMSVDCQPSQREPLAQVQNASRRLLATINNLVDLTRFEERVSRTEHVDLRSVVQRAIDDASNQAADRHVSLVADIGEPVQGLTGDAWATRRIVENILDNAVKFSPRGGVVKISMASSSSDVAVTVSDTGAGMPEFVLSAIREPPSRWHAGSQHELEGVGTGLALCRRLAAIVGAELFFESQPATGTRATVRFPLAA